MNDPPRALVVDLSRKFGGASARALGLVEGLPRGAAALACLEGSPVERQAAARGLERRVVGSHKADPRIAGRLAALARAEGFGILDAQNPQSKLWSALGARRAGIALVSTLNSWYLHELRGTLRGRVYQEVERRTSRGTDLFIAVSREIRAEILASGIPEEAVALIPNAIGLDPTAVPRDGGALFASLGVPAGAPVAIAVGRLVTAKGHAVLLEAIASLAGEAAHAVIVGEGPLRRDLEERIGRLGLAGRVHLAGERDPSEVLRMVLAADVFVMPSTTEGTPLALLEAAALGKPIVASRVGGIPDVLGDGAEARLVPPADPAPLAQALRAILADRDAAGRLGSAARSRVLAAFGLGAQIEATRRAYDDAWARSRRRASAS